MKKFTLALMALLALTFSVKAQQFVSTEPSNRNVVIEEFTGRNCGYCPLGHKATKEIMAAHPGRVWAINIHCTNLSPTTYPNLNITKGHSIANGFSFNGIPMGLVNRHSGSCTDVDNFNSMTTARLNQPAECNVGGRVILNPETRVANITVEVYYTANSNSATNYLTIAMLQDSILGAQSDYGNYNPTQWIGNQYVHLHTLRDIVTTNLWGDEVAPTTQGSLVTLNYTYAIPESIGSPNGVEVDLNNIHFVAFVTEQYQGTPTRPILNACQLDMIQGSEEPIYPMISNVSMEDGITCTHSKNVGVNITNIGTETLTSMTINAEFEGETQTINWQGELPQFDVEKVSFPIEAPYGSHNVTISITEANGQPVNKETVYTVECLEWVDLDIEGQTEELKLLLVQDKWGAQITWKFTASDGTVLAEGGPYVTLPGGGTSPHIETVTVPANECVMFAIYDSGQNGICCDNGDGYYQIKDSHNNVIIDGDGDFGAEAKHLISVKGEQAQMEIGETAVSNVTMTSADFVATLTYSGTPDEVGFSYYKEDDPNNMTTAPGSLNESNEIILHVDDLEPETDYVVKAYVNVAGELFYGAETAFSTENTGISEFEKSLAVYPNPAKDVLNVKGMMTQVEVYNTMGQCLMSKQVNGQNAQISLAGFDNGIYFLRISNNGETAVRKFSVNR